MSSEAEKLVERYKVPPIKVFVHKESPLTELWTSNADVQAVYNMAFALTILLTMFTISTYAIDPDHFHTDIAFLGWAFQSFSTFWLIWSLLMTSSIVPFTLVRRYLSNSSNSTAGLVRNYQLYMLFAFFAPIPAIMWSTMSIVLKFALLMEQVRFIMKIHSFVAECSWMSNKEKMADLSKRHLIYFLFAPTLVFKLTYPRTPTRNFRRALAYGFQFFGTTFIAFLLLPRYVQRHLGDFGHVQYDRKSFINLVLISTLMGIMVLFTIFYGILHCWLNMWAELLRFADRRFYDKWWLLDAYSKYYREWNLVVHDWLHNYVYREVILMTSGNKTVAALATFLISAVFHEYIITMALGFYYPVLFVLFAFLGVTVYFVSINFPTHEKSYGNVFLFFSIFLGWSVQIVFYAAEYYARQNCPREYNFFLDLVIPRSWTCSSN